MDPTAQFDYEERMDAARPSMTFGSLFAGIGGFDLGMERAGWECRWQVENDEYANRVLAKHWPHVKRYGDIRTVRGADLEPVDCICGGFPCQDLSQAGKRAGIEGSRSGLWFEFARLVHELRPRYVFAENVSGLLVRGAMDRVVGELAGLGYVGCWLSLRASDFGASHLRKRIFIVAHRTGDGWDEGRSESAGIERRPDAAECGGDMEHAEHRGLQDGWTGGAGPLRARRGADLRHAAAESGGVLADSECSERRPHFEHERLQGGRIEAADRSGSAGDTVENANALLGEQLARRWPERGEARRTGSHGKPSGPSCGLAFAPGPSDPRWPAILRDRPDLAPALEPSIRGVADGLSCGLDRAMSNRTKRLGRLGNAVVPDAIEWIAARLLGIAAC